MLHRTSSNRFLSRVIFYSAVVALLWVLEKVADAQKESLPAPPVHGFVVQPDQD